MQRQSRVLAVAVITLFPAFLWAAVDPKTAAADYASLQTWQYTAQPIPLAKPVTISRDGATWVLSSGNVRLLQPTSSGPTTGLVFEGDGRFAMTVPDKYELAQLRRFTQQPGLEKIDVPFSELVLRTSDDTIGKLFPGPVNGPFAGNGSASKRQNHWLIDLRTDIDARIVAARTNAGAFQMMAGFKTKDFDWLTYDYDSNRDEEIQMIRFPQVQPEVWLSLDRAEDRKSDGRPGNRSSQPATLNFIDVNADLSHRKWSAGRSGETNQQRITGHYVVDEELSAARDGMQTLVLEIDGTAQNVAVKDDQGRPLTILRDHIGARAVALENNIWDSKLTIVFPAPLKKNDDLHLTFEYDLETDNYGYGNSWYPTVPNAFDAHTARIVLTVPKKNAVRAMGRMDKQTEGDKTTTSIWIVDKPTMMVTFATAEHFEEEAIEAKGIPTIVSFGWAAWTDVKTRVRNSGADVANSMMYFQSLLGPLPATEKFYVTSIIGDHGQAFDGFLHLAESTYSEHPGASELFRAHEVAHEWFGHRVGWRSYRDQWLSEALAEYAAMMFVQSTVKDGPKYFNEILRAYDSGIKGSLSGAFSKFYRPWLVGFTAAQRNRLGPIGHGYRASTSEIPWGYYLQTYVKGPLVLNMLREILRAKTHSDDMFVTILRDFVQEYGGKLASTEDFERIVERDSQTDFRWFFSNWIYGAEIPTLRWSYHVEPAGDKYRLTMTIKKSDVPDDFMIVAPVRVEFEGGKAGIMFAVVKDQEQTITRDLPMRPRDVKFAPDYALLANVRKE